MRERLSDYQELYGDLYNLEATPAESTSYRLAKHDLKRYPDIINAARNADEAPYYTNSSHLPVGYTDDIFTALDIQDKLQTLYTSGTVFHAFLGEKLPDWKAAATLVRKIAENYELPYYTLSPTYSVCKDHGYIAGEVYECPTCGNKTEVYSRITGYYRPVQNWNDGKSQEYQHRKVYDIANSKLTHGAPNTEVAEVAETAPAIANGTYLFATVTCPNCKIAKSLLDKAGVVYEVMYANEHADMVNALGIKTAPTLVVVNGDEVHKCAGVSEIKKMLNQ
jgi:ribonucleoside-triphosphate reductase